MNKTETAINRLLANDTTGTVGNTTVKRDGNGNTLHVELHGNLIATYRPADNTLNIADADWRTNTTKSRLNALLGEFAPGYRIVQRDHVWYLDQLGIEISENVSLKDILVEWPGSATFDDGCFI